MVNEGQCQTCSSLSLTADPQIVQLRVPATARHRHQLLQGLQLTGQPSWRLLLIEYGQQR
jgi:hypothetical protein